MWRGGRTTQTKRGNNGLVVVAVDADKSSQVALKWAADNLISKNQIFHLLHVRRKVTIRTPTGQVLQAADVDDDVASTLYNQLDIETNELLLPFQCFCSRRGLQFKEVILEEFDISKAIVDYLIHQSVDKLVLGASSRNAFMRTFRQADVPTSVSKLAPEFCSIYVIAKGKISSVRPALKPNKHLISRQPSLKSDATGSSCRSAKSDPVPWKAMEESPKCSSAIKDGAGSSDLSTVSVSSCPSPSRNSTEQSFHNLTREHLDGMAHQTRRSDLHKDKIKYNDSIRYGDSSWSNGSESGFSNWSVRAGSDGNQSCSKYSLPQGQFCRSGRSPPQVQAYGTGYLPSLQSQGSLPQSESSGTGYSSSSQARTHGGSYLQSESYRAGYSSPKSSTYGSGSCRESESYMTGYSLQEEMDVELRRLKLELKHTSDHCADACKEASSGRQKAHKPYVRGISSQASNQMHEFWRGGEISGVSSSGALERNDAGRNPIGENKFLDVLPINVKYRRYTPKEIEKATDNFSDALKIGEGGYGPVFRSILDHTLVAIKVLRSDEAQGMKQFHQEVEVLSTIRHPNMVLLMGACPEYGCLIYEYMSNGSLEDCLFRRNSTLLLSWQLRFKIAAEIATALLFLHQNKPEPLVHRDLKPGNILLDHNFVSKIADVGLARLIPPSVADAITQYCMTAAAGTFCYIDPEYQKTGLLGIKSDIYALGIILLQLITAKPPMGLAHNVEDAIESGCFESMLDPNVPDWPMEETIRFAKLSLKCAELSRKDRPDLGSVVLPELDRLRAMADESLPNSKLFHHVTTWHRQGAFSIPSVDGPSFLSEDDIGKAYPASIS